MPASVYDEPSAQHEQQRAQRLRKTARWILGVGTAVMMALGLVLLFLLTVATNNRQLYEDYYVWLFGLNVLVAGLLLLLLYRLMHPVTRLISRAGDYAATLLVFLVMLSGCLALARAYEPLRLLHLLLAELLLIYFPFSTLMHAFTFTVSRGYTGAGMARKGVNA